MYILLDMTNDDGYQGISNAAPMTERETEFAALTDAWVRADEAAQNANDREDYARASKFAAQARALKAQLDAMRVAS